MCISEFLEKTETMKKTENPQIPNLITVITWFHSLLLPWYILANSDSFLYWKHF